MSKFTLNIGFTNKQLKLIYAAGANVIVAKPTQREKPNVAWQVFKPMGENNLEWEEVYGIYASTARIVNGAKLIKSSEVMPALMDQKYKLEPSGAISPPGPGGVPNSFRLANEYKHEPIMTFGLYQGANVNGAEIVKNAISAKLKRRNSKIFTNKNRRNLGFFESFKKN